MCLNCESHPFFCDECEEGYLLIPAFNEDSGLCVEIPEDLFILLEEATGEVEERLEELLSEIENELTN